jgi:hypothetical protein
MKLNIVRTAVFYNVMPCAVTNVSEERAASIFRVVNIYPESEGRIFVLNFHKHVQNYTALRPKR